METRQIADRPKIKLKSPDRKKKKSKTRKGDNLNSDDLENQLFKVREMPEEEEYKTEEQKQVVQAWQD